MRAKLALDLGTSTGFAIGKKGHVVSGTWSFKPSRYEGGGMRFLRFRRKLDEVYSITPFDEVWFEEVRRHMSTDAAHVYGGLMAMLTSWCEDNRMPYIGVPVGTIKSSWTGKGNSNKEAMVAEANRRGFTTDSDDEADALALFHLKIEEVESNEHDAAVSVPKNRSGILSAA